MHKENKKITTIAALCSALNEIGGMSKHLLNLYLNIDRDRYRFLIIYCSARKDIIERFFLQRGVKKEDLFYFPTSKKILFIPLVMKLRKLFIEEDVDIVHTFFLHSDIIGFFSAFLASVRKLVSSVEGKFLLDDLHGVGKIKQACYATLNRIIRPYFYKTITVSAELKNELVCGHLVPEDKVEIIHIGIDIPSEKEISIHLPSKENLKEKIIGTASRFSKDKKVEYFLKAVSKVSQEVPQAKFVVAGRGNEERNLKELTVNLGIQSIVSFPGWIEDISNFMSKIDVFVMTSAEEGCPIALLEALSFAKPVVAFDVPGIKEIINNGENGILVEPFNLEQFVFAITRVSKNLEYAKKLGENGRKLIQAKYSTIIEIKKIDMLYRDLLNS
jgi:glycosyltransferase involved in cell wall biosynthesis